MGKTKTGILKGVWSSEKPTLPRIYRIWKSMKQRCRDKNYNAYKRYGAVGIKVSYDWLEFENFYNDMNESYERHCKEFGEDNTSLDRIDGSKGYSIENCRWATRKEQANNTKRNLSKRYIKFNGEKIKLTQFIDTAKFCNSTVIKKLKTMSADEILKRKRISLFSKNYDTRNWLLTKDMSCLDNRKRKIIEMRYGLIDGIGNTLEEVGYEFKVTSERIRQIEAKALELIKKYDK